MSLFLCSLFFYDPVVSLLSSYVLLSLSLVLLLVCSSPQFHSLAVKAGRNATAGGTLRDADEGSVQARVTIGSASDDDAIPGRHSG